MFYITSISKYLDFFIISTFIVEKLWEKLLKIFFLAVCLQNSNFGDVYTSVYPV